jgi:glutaredoxin 3
MHGHFLPLRYAAREKRAQGPGACGARVWLGRPPSANGFERFMSSDVVVYTAPFCFFCLRAKQLLTKKGIDFSEVDVRTLADGRRWLRARTGRVSVPQIFINDVFVGGYAELASLEREGALDGLLSEPNAR